MFAQVSEHRHVLIKEKKEKEKLTPNLLVSTFVQAMSMKGHGSKVAVFNLQVSSVFLSLLFSDSDSDI